MADDTFAPATAPVTTPTQPSPDRRPGAFAPLRRRGFTLLFTGQLVSALGDQAYAIALPWTVLAITGDPRQMAVVLAAGSVARVLALLIGGALADRISPWVVMLTADAGRTVVVGVLGAALFVGLPPLWVVALLAGFEGLGSGFFTPGVLAIIPSTVPEEQLPGANGLMQIIQFLSLVFGPILGGVATATQASIALLADAGSFLVSTLTLGAMRLPRRPRASSAGMASDIRAGLRYAFGMPLIRTTMVIGIIGNIGFAGAFGVGVIVLARNLSHSPVTLGIFLTLIGVGGIIGGLSAAAFGRLKRRGVVTASLWVVVAAALAIIPLAAGTEASALPVALPIAASLRIPLVAAATGVIGIVIALGDTMLLTIMQQQVEPSFLARVSSIMVFAGSILQPLAIIGAGVLVATAGPGSTFLGAAALMLVAALFGLFSRALRQV